MSPTYQKVFKDVFVTLQTGLSKLGDATSQTRSVRDLERGLIQLLRIVDDTVLVAHTAFHGLADGDEKRTRSAGGVVNANLVLVARLKSSVLAALGAGGEGCRHPLCLRYRAALQGRLRLPATRLIPSESPLRTKRFEGLMPRMTKFMRVRLNVD